MSTEYGSIFSSRDTANQLREANRDYEGRKTWENLYAGIDIAEKQQLGLLQRDYAKQLSDAYTSSYLSKQAINASNMGQGYKLAADENVDLALEEAFNSYRMNYLQNKANVEAASAESVAAVDDALKTQADYTVRMANAPYGYLKELWNRYAEGEEKDNIFFNDPYYKDYVIDRASQDDINKDIHDYQLKTWDEIKDVNNYEINSNGQKEWKGLFDANGNLTVKGADFYDKMMNDRGNKGDYSFGQWLMENDSDLYDWSQSYNPYNYTEAGTNRGTFNTLVGLTSTDQTYSFLERYGGLTESELNEKFNNFVKAMELPDKLQNAIETNADNSKTLVKSYTQAVNNIKQFTDELEITDALEKEYGFKFDDIAEQLQEFMDLALSPTKLRSEIWKENKEVDKQYSKEIANKTLDDLANWLEDIDFDYHTIDLLRTDAAKNAAAYLLRFQSPLFNQLIIPAIYAAKHNINTPRQDLRAKNVKYAEEAKKAYADFVAQLVKFAQQQRANAQKEFNI